jgi:GntR family transcriptional regulator, transcriptional repressor for pyruvate dehydrogenase complex
MFKTVTREQTLTERTQRQLEELILSGKLTAGERLPSESQMSKMLGVSRTVVREAVRLLSAKGLVELRAGSGIYVREMNSGMIRDPMDLLLRSRTITVQDIVDVRALIEVHLAGLAAQRASAADIAALEETIAKLQNHKLSPSESAEMDVAFHAGLAAAAGNPLFAVLAQSINTVMIEPIRDEYGRHDFARADAIREHSLILDRVRARDPEGARHAMAESLAVAPRNWDGYMPRASALLRKLPRTSKNNADGDGAKPAPEAP